MLMCLTFQLEDSVQVRALAQKTHSMSGFFIKNILKMILSKIIKVRNSTYYKNKGYIIFKYNL